MMKHADNKKSFSIKKILFLAGGTVFLGIGFIGIILPVLPTTPFLLLSAFCFIRGSQRMYVWLISNKIFGSFIKNYYAGKGITVGGYCILSNFHDTLSHYSNHCYWYRSWGNYPYSFHKNEPAEGV